MHCLQSRCSRVRWLTQRFQQGMVFGRLTQGPQRSVIAQKLPPSGDTDYGPRTQSSATRASKLATGFGPQRSTSEVCETGAAYESLAPSSEFSTFNPGAQRKCANGAGGDAVVKTINAAPRRLRLWPSARPRPGRIPATPEGGRGPSSSAGSRR